MPTKTIFSERLKHLFEKVNEQEVAKVLGVDLTIFYDYLKKEHLPSYKTALRLRKFFRLSLDFLFGLSEDDSPVNIPKEEKPFSEIFKAIFYFNNGTLLAKIRK